METKNSKIDREIIFFDRKRPVKTYQAPEPSAGEKRGKILNDESPLTLFDLHSRKFCWAAGRQAPLFSDITAYHGSPLEFGVQGFSIEKVGTGADSGDRSSGASGWGLYFAADREVAELFIAPKKFGVAWSGVFLDTELGTVLFGVRMGKKGFYLDGVKGLRSFSSLDDGVRYFLEHTAVPFFPPDSFYSEGWRKKYQEFFDSTKVRVLRWLDRIGSDRVDRFGFKLSSVEEQRDYAKRVVEGFKPGFRGRFSGGNIYEVRLQVDSGNLLFLEKSFRKQSPLVQDALMKAVGRPIDPLELGFDVYFSFLGGDREASLLLLSLGVRGLVSEEAGHTVYVIFSDKFVKIVDQPRYHDPRFDEGELFASCSRKFR